MLGATSVQKIGADPALDRAAACLDLWLKSAYLDLRPNAEMSLR
jgi:hypothetical protein